MLLSLTGLDLSRVPPLDIRRFHQVPAHRRNRTLEDGEKPRGEVQKMDTEARMVERRGRASTSWKYKKTGTKKIQENNNIGHYVNDDDDEYCVMMILQVLQAIQEAEKMEKPSLAELFSDVYDKVPSNLKEQEMSLRDIVMRHPKDYPADVPV